MATKKWLRLTGKGGRFIEMGRGEGDREGEAHREGQEGGGRDRDKGRDTDTENVVMVKTPGLLYPRRACLKLMDPPA